MTQMSLSFDDVSIIPAYSDLDSRDEVDLTSDVGFAKLSLPLISSCMDTVTELPMLRAMYANGASGIHHRYCSESTLMNVSEAYPIAASPSLGVDFIKSIVENYNPNPILCLDIAHGHSRKALEYAEACVKLGAVVISGNIVTAEAAVAYHDVGVNIFRVGIGSGASCQTRVVAGVGIPQFTAIQNMKNLFDDPYYVISDGGCSSSGDIVKVLSAGACAVILGRLLSPADEAPGKRRWSDHYKELVARRYDLNNQDQKEFRGMASPEALSDAGKDFNFEGVSSWVKCEGPVSGILERLKIGMQHGFSYVGARNIRELQQKAQFVRVTHAGLIEGKPRI